MTTKYPCLSLGVSISCWSRGLQERRVGESIQGSEEEWDVALPSHPSLWPFPTHQAGMPTHLCQFLLNSPFLVASRLPMLFKPSVPSSLGPHLWFSVSLLPVLFSPVL